MTESFVYTTYINAASEAVWQALTSAEFTRQYWAGTAVESDWTPGAPVTTRHPDGRDFHGEVLRAEPPRLLSYTFQTQDNEAAGHAPTRVVFEIKPFGDVVILTVTHDEFPEGSAGTTFRRAISQGWPGILSNLKTLLETGEPMPYPEPYSTAREQSAP